MVFFINSIFTKTDRVSFRPNKYIAHLQNLLYFLKSSLFLSYVQLDITNIQLLAPSTVCRKKYHATLKLITWMCNLLHIMLQYVIQITKTCHQPLFYSTSNSSPLSLSTGRTRAD